MKRFAIIAIVAILPLSLSSCAGGYSSEKGWYVGTDAAAFKYIVGEIRDDRNSGYKK